MSLIRILAVLFMLSAVTATALGQCPGPMPTAPSNLSDLAQDVPTSGKFSGWSWTGGVGRGKALLIEGYPTVTTVCEVQFVNNGSHVRFNGQSFRVIKYRDEAVTPEISYSGLASCTRYALLLRNITPAQNDVPPWRIVRFRTAGCQNSIPTLNPVEVPTVREGGLVSFVVQAGDGDLPFQSLTFSLDVAPVGASIVAESPTQARVSWQTGESEGPGAYPFTVRVTDNASPPASRTASLVANVLESNAPPTLAVANQVVREGETLSFTLAAADADAPAQPLTYAKEGGPERLHVASSGLVTWTPTEEQGPGTYVVAVRVSDQSGDPSAPSLSATASFTVTVVEVNLPPVIAPIANVSIPELQPWSMTVDASDPDLPKNTLTYGLVEPPAGMNIDSATGRITWTPSEAQGPGVYIVAVRVSDQSSDPIAPSLSATASFIVTVVEVNLPPVIAPISNVSIPELQPWSMTVTASDPDLPKNTLTYDLVEPPAGMNIDSATGRITWTPSEAQGPGAYIVAVRVSDQSSDPIAPSLSATISFTVTVVEVNLPPVIAPISNVSIPELQPWSMTVTASDPDLPKNTLTYDLVQAPSGMSINRLTGQISWKPTEAQGPGTFRVEVKVNDGQLEATRGFNVDVREVNVPPRFRWILPPIEDPIGIIGSPGTIIIDEGSQYVLAVEDEDIPRQPLSLATISGPAGMSLADTSTNILVTWNTSEIHGPSTNQIVLRASDGVATSNGQWTVEVREINEPPSFTGLSNATIFVGQAYAQTLSAQDPDYPAQVLRLRLLEGPAGASVSNSVLRWTPSRDQAPSTNRVRLEVDDGVLFVTNSIQIVVLRGTVETFSLGIGQQVSPGVIGGTNAPGAGRVGGPGDVDEYVFEAVEGQRLYVDETFGDSAALTWECIAPGTGWLWQEQRLGTWHDVVDIPDVGVVVVPRTGTYKIVVRGTGEYGFRLVHSPVREPLRIRLTDRVKPGRINDMTQIDGRPVPDWVGRLTIPGEVGTYSFEVPTRQVFHFDYLDADEGWLVWWRLVGPNGTVFWDTPLAFSGGSLPWFTVPSGGIYTLQVYGYGGYVGNYGFQLGDISARLNTPPTLAGATNSVINELEPYTQPMVPRDSDIPVQPLTVSLVSGPAGLVVTNGVLAWTPSELQGGTTNPVVVRVTDGVANVTDSFNIVVRETNELPSMAGATNAVINELVPYTQAMVPRDSDIPVQPLTVSLVSGPAGLVVTNGVLAWTPTEAQGPSTNLVRVQVTDGVASVTNSLVITVRGNVTPPFFRGATNATIFELAAHVQNLLPSSLDLPMPALRSTLISGPAGLLVTTNGVLSWTPSEAQGPSTNVVQVAVSNGGLVTTNTFTLVVLETNAPPVLRGATNTTIDEIAGYTQPLAPLDTDIPVQSLAVSLVSGPLGLVVTNAVLALTPSELQGGTTNPVVVRVTDGVVTVTNSFNVVVRETNELPTLAGATNSVINELVPYTQAMVPRDSDIPVQPLTVSLVSGPAGLVVTNGVLAWTPSESQGPGTHPVVVRVTDGVASVTNAFTLTVLEVNRPPRLTGLAPAAFDELTSFTRNLNPTDDDLPLQPLMVSVVNGPAGLVVINGVLAWQPSEAQGPSTNVITLAVTDGIATVTNSITLSVREVNVPPVLELATSATIHELVGYTQDLGAKDTDVPVQAVTVTLIAGPAGLVVTNGVLSWTPTETQGPSTNMVLVRATDGVATVTNTLSIVVREVNSLPTFLGATNGVTDELTGFVRDLAARDTDVPVQVLTVSLASGPAGVVVTNGVLAWTPTEAQGPSTNTVLVRVTDGVATVTNALTIIVREVNSLPILLGATNGVMDELAGFVRDLAARDSDLPVQALKVALVSGPSGMVVTNGILAWTPTEVQGPVTNEVRVSVTDGVATVTNVFAIVVREVNVPPALMGATNGVIDELAGFVRDLVPRDVDIPAQALAVSLVSGPLGLTISANGLLSWTPTEAQGPSTNAVVVRLTDGIATITNTFSVVVREVNAAPVFASLANLVVLEGFTAMRDLGMTDPDIPVQVVRSRLVSGPPGAVLTNGVFTWRTTEADGPSTREIRVEITDGMVTLTNSFTVQVREVNSPPTFTNVADLVAPEEVAVLRPLGATDTDIPAQALTVTLVQGPAGAVVTNGVFSWTPTEAHGPSTNTVMVQGTDGVSTTRRSFRIVVNEVNRLPVLGSLAARDINEGTTLSVPVSVTDADVPTQSVTVSAFLRGPAGNRSLEIVGGQIVWPTSEQDGPSTNLVLVVASDGVGSVTNQFQVVVREVNVAPAFVGLTNATLLIGQAYVQPLIMTDPDVPAQTLRATLASGPTGLVVTNGRLSWRPQSGQGGTTNTVRLVASDGVASVTNTLLLMVRTNVLQEFRLALGQDVEPGKVGGVATNGAGRIDAAGDIDEYVFEGTAGQWVYVDERLGDSSRLEWEARWDGGSALWDAVGLGVTNVTVEAQDVGKVRLPETGSYRIRVRGQGEYGFRLAVVPKHEPLRMGLTDLVTPGQVNGAPVLGGVGVPSWVGRITEPGEVDAYEFEGAEGQVIHFEYLQADDPARVLWSLVGPLGDVYWETPLATSGDVLPWMGLPSTGLYTLVLYGQTDYVGGYGFQLRDVGASLGAGRLGNRRPSLAAAEASSAPLLRVRMSDAGSLGIEWEGGFDAGVHVEESEDLVHWEPIDGTVHRVAGGVGRLEVAPGRGHRFYRVRSGP